MPSPESATFAVPPGVPLMVTVAALPLPARVGEKRTENVQVLPGWPVAARVAPWQPFAPTTLNSAEFGPVIPTVSGPVAAPGSATWALVLGIAGVVIFPLLFSIPAWVVGRRARRECRVLPGRPGYGMATTGWVLGILGTLGWILIGVLVLWTLWLIGSSESAFD